MSAHEPENSFYHGPDAFDSVLIAERAAIAARSKRNNSGAWTGIALSGGGIRSASFCLGALQALEKCTVLRKIDYISTVSGGGYIGAGLQWSLYRNAQEGATGKGFPYGVDADLYISSPDQGQSDLQYLRWHANYLLPGDGLDIFSALNVVLRAVFLSLAIWLPVITLAFLVMQFIESRPAVLCYVNDWNIGNPVPGLIDVNWGAGIAESCKAWRRGETEILQSFWPHEPGHLSLFFGLFIYVAYACLVLLALLPIVVAFVSITRFPQNLNTTFILGALLSGSVGGSMLFFALPQLNEQLTHDRPDILSLGVFISVATLGAAFFLPIINLLGLLLLRSWYKNAEYLFRRTSEIIGGRLLQVSVYAATFGSLPLVGAYVFKSGWVSNSGGAIGALLGLISAVLGHLSQSRRINLGPLGQTFTAVAACMFLYVVLVFTYHVNSLLFDPIHDSDTLYNCKLAFGAIALLAVLFGVLSNSNSTGLHRFYRDRLMELFMPSARSVRSGRSTYSFAADRLSISELWKGPTPAINLYPIVNCNAILVNDKNPVLSNRGGANVALTPLHIGSAVHGWENCDSYERKNRDMTLATAVAASGAAANAHAGYVGAGVTRNRAVSLVLMLLNVRLGVWVRRPSKSAWINLLKPTPFFPNLWYGFLSLGYKSESNFVELSDGGHFENLGVYELVRRRVDLIMAFDGEADPTTCLPALVSLTRRLEEDFGATLDFGSELDSLMPSAPDQAKYPTDAKYAKVPFAKGTITYSDTDQKTVLIYVKATLVDAAPFIARGYRAAHRDFPNESTANQFYSPAQFDAYRELGLQCTDAAVQKHTDEINALCDRRTN